MAVRAAPAVGKGGGFSAARAMVGVGVRSLGGQPPELQSSEPRRTAAGAAGVLPVRGKARKHATERSSLRFLAHRWACASLARRRVAPALWRQHTSCLVSTAADAAARSEAGGGHEGATSPLAHERAWCLLHARSLCATQVRCACPGRARAAARHSRACGRGAAGCYSLREPGNRRRGVQSLHLCRNNGSRGAI